MPSTLRRVDTHPGQWSDSAVKTLSTPPQPFMSPGWVGVLARLRQTMVSTWGIFISAQVLNGRNQ
ncbi:hypothetical protein LU632_05635 [Erwinia tracheiphila]|uniref:hypothetical protein n=1 Tax=Erwinia tracheiphila TaxID=65700 RepID=UPI001F2A11E8|nr:hypothetical protein [Erwinia tracheiphila]UIA93055.1 hypothetical protein LU632_05635 [Erwinia tracheiphila]